MTAVKLKNHMELQLLSAVLLQLLLLLLQPHPADESGTEKHGKSTHDSSGWMNACSLCLSSISLSTSRAVSLPCDEYQRDPPRRGSRTPDGKTPERRTTSGRAHSHLLSEGSWGCWTLPSPLLPSCSGCATYEDQRFPGVDKEGWRTHSALSPTQMIIPPARCQRSPSGPPAPS